MRKFISGLVILTLLSPVRSQAIIGDGGAGWANAAYLAKILMENYKRYVQLTQMIQNAKDHDQYIRALNMGLENTVGLLHSLPIRDEKILEDLRNFEKSYKKVVDIYGQIPKTKEEALHALHDQSIAESFRMINSFKDYSRQQEENSVILKVQAREASPKGAARMTAEANALILQSINQLIRLQSQSLKLQSEQLAMLNRNGKRSAASFQKINEDLGFGFAKFKPSNQFAKF